MTAPRMEGGTRNHQYALLVRDFPTEEGQTSAVVMPYLTFEQFLSLLELGAMNSLHVGCLNPDGNPLSDDQLAGQRIICDPNPKGLYVKCGLQDLVAKIIVGPNAQPHFYTLVKRLISRYRLFIEVEKACLSPKQ